MWANRRAIDWSNGTPFVSIKHNKIWFRVAASARKSSSRVFTQPVSNIFALWNSWIDPGYFDNWKWSDEDELTARGIFVRADDQLLIDFTQKSSFTVILDIFSICHSPNLLSAKREPFFGV